MAEFYRHKPTNDPLPITMVPVADLVIVFTDSQSAGVSHYRSVIKAGAELPVIKVQKTMPHRYVVHQGASCVMAAKMERLTEIKAQVI